MKKVLFLQNKGNSYGGVWQVNRMIGEALLKLDYEVQIVSLMENHNDLKLYYDKNLQVYTIDKEGIWETYLWSEIIGDLKHCKLITVFKKSFMRIKHNKLLKNDKTKLQEYIRNYDPNYIITTHYQLIDMIPHEYLSHTIHEQHTSFNSTYSHKATFNTLKKYNNKISFLWLSKASLKLASEKGLLNNYSIYNSVPFIENNGSKVLENKRLITIARLSKEKRIDIMIRIMNNLFKDNCYKNWSFYIYGDGSEYEELNKLITNHQQIKLMGRTDNAHECLLSSSINLNTSLMEGFAISILEANECGVPTISFNFGESVYEEILHNKTGYIIENDNIEEYTRKLKELMDNETVLERFSKNCKEFSKEFYIDNIIKEWIKLFNKIDEK